MKSTADPRELLGRFWRELEEVKTGMLGVAGDSRAQAQPMTAHFEGGRGPLFFFARRDSELAQDAATPQGAAFHYASGGHDLYACVQGELSVQDDREAASRFWTEAVARWFPGGPDDPNLTVLRFDPQRAHIWLPKESDAPTAYGFDADGPTDVRAEARL